MQKLSILFLLIISLILNLIWENLHSILYVHYMGNTITESILFRASVIDMLMIFLICLPFILFKKIEKYDWLIIPIGFTVAICLELFALSTGRWAYNDLMPIIPILSVGLTPAVQLGLLGYISFRIQKVI